MLGRPAGHGHTQQQHHQRQARLWCRRVCTSYHHILWGICPWFAPWELWPACRTRGCRSRRTQTRSWSISPAPWPGWSAAWWWGRCFCSRSGGSPAALQSTSAWKQRRHNRQLALPGPAGRGAPGAQEAGALRAVPEHAVGGLAGLGHVAALVLLLGLRQLLRGGDRASGEAATTGGGQLSSGGSAAHTPGHPPPPPAQPDTKRGWGLVPKPSRLSRRPGRGWAGVRQSLVAAALCHPVPGARDPAPPAPWGAGEPLW